MIASIVLQRHSFLSPVFSFIGIVSILMSSSYVIFAGTSIERKIGLVFCIVITFYVILEHIKRYLFLKNGYASVIQIMNNELRLVYSYFGGKKIKNVSFADIKNFKVNIKSGMILCQHGSRAAGKMRCYNIVITIDTIKEHIELPVHPNLDPAGNLDFMYPLLDVCDKIPNFSYEIEGDAFLKETFKMYIDSK